MAEILNMFDDVAEDEEEQMEAPSSPARKPLHVVPPSANTTRGLEQRVEQVPGTPAPEQVLQLLSVFGDRGQVRVAMAVNGQRIEEWRDPTEKEWVQLRERGRLIKGGIGQAAPAVVAPVAPPAPTPLTIGGFPVGKLLVGGLALAGVGAALYFWRQNKLMEENTEEVD